MTSNSQVKQYAEELSAVLNRIEDAKVEAAAIIEAAKDSGVDVKALRKVAREMVMMPDKLAKRFEAEEQLELFRSVVGIRKRKGIEGRSMKEAAE